MKSLQPLKDKAVATHEILISDRCYLINLSTNECTCLDYYYWRGSFCDPCKHIHGPRLYQEAIETNNIEGVRIEVKKKLAKYIRDRERGQTPSVKNLLLYDNDDEVVFKEFLRIYLENPSTVFYPRQRPPSDKDPFRPKELPNRQRKTEIGAPQQHAPKRRKPSRILRCVVVDDENDNESPTQTERFLPHSITTSTRNRKRSGSQNSEANIANANQEIGRNSHCDENDCDQENLYETHTSVPTTQILTTKSLVWDIELIKHELENLFQQEKRLWISLAFTESCIVNGFVESEQDMNKKDKNVAK